MQALPPMTAGSRVILVSVPIRFSCSDRRTRRHLLDGDIREVPVSVRARFGQAQTILFQLAPEGIGSGRIDSAAR